MKRLLTFAAIFSSLNISAKFVQVIYTKAISENIKINNGYYTFEDDKVSIVYDFWADHGSMQFIVYNKTDRPIYVDWNKSAFISQKVKISYYEDREKLSGVTTSLNHSSIIALGSGVSVSFMNATKVREEKITFIPPKTSVSKNFNNLISNIYYEIDKDEAQEKDIDGAKVYELVFSQEITFRNFITYSTTDKFDNEFYIDNGFKLIKVQTMKEKDFNGTIMSGAIVQNTYPFYRATRFYIDQLKRAKIFKSE